MCLESWSVRAANVRQIFILRGPNGSKPSWRSWPEWDGSHCPAMAAMAILWALSSSRAWPRVRPECQTGHAISRWTLPSDFQKSTRVVWLTPRAFILLNIQVVLLALLTISLTCELQRRSSWTNTPRIRSVFSTFKVSLSPIVNCGGNAHVLDLLNSITKLFLLLTPSLFWVQKASNLSSSYCSRFSLLLSLICVLS